MTTEVEFATIVFMNEIPEHEKLFDEISYKLSELSNRDEQVQPHQQKLEKMQHQIRKFHSELQDTQDEFRNKIRSLENVTISQNEVNQKMKTFTEQLNHERSLNTKLNGDLAKSLEISLQLQLEVQGLKSRSQHTYNEEKKYSQNLSEKLRATQKDLELVIVVKDELAIEFEKAKNNFAIEAQEAKNRQDTLENMVSEKNQMIANLNIEMESLSQSLNEIEHGALQQNEAMKNLMTVAENKIVEMKLALDKKNIETQDYYSHLQQALTQLGMLRSENSNLKDYIQKVNTYLQQQQNQQQLQQNQNQST
ncbi:MAG: hypothetical protein AABY64_07485 [Bdellovibrionota bacterium]